MFKQLSINVWIYVPTNVLQSSLREACTSWVDMLTNHSIDLKFQYCV